jgi:hypothetical protein
MMQTEYVVWCPDRGATKEDGRHINAFDHESAATRWAKWDDAHSADYTIVGGSDAIVLVAAVDDGAPEHKFTVSGESVPVYRAQKTR